LRAGRPRFLHPSPSTQAQIAVNNSLVDVIYKGLAIGESAGHAPRLYATDFHNGKVDVFDGSFGAVHVAGAFEGCPSSKDFAPFGIQNIGGKIFVTFAKQDADAEDNLNGQGKGFVDVFDGDGKRLRRFAQRGQLNAPWGIALAPSNFGRFSGDVLIGNFGNGQINAYDFKTGEHRGTLRGPAREKTCDRGPMGARIRERCRCGTDQHAVLCRGGRMMRRTDCSEAARPPTHARGMAATMTMTTVIDRSGRPEGSPTNRLQRRLVGRRPAQ